jgi:hypothetical protein
MNKRYLYSFTACLIAILLTAFSEHTKKIAVEQCSIENNSFAGGEKLVYKMYYNLGLLWIPAGEVTFSVNESKENFELKAVGKTYKSYESIFKINDYFYSKVDKKTLLPKNFVRIVEEGNYRLYDSISFDQKRNIAVSYHGKTKSDTKPQVHRLNNCMQDLMSNIYFMRNLNMATMKKGDQIGTHMFFDKAVYPIQIGYGGKETKDIKGLGDFRTLKLMPNVVEGNVFKKGDQISIWVSDDKNRIPLMIESPISVGSVKAVLKSHSGLKYNIDSKI